MECKQTTQNIERLFMTYIHFILIDRFKELGVKGLSQVRCQSVCWCQVLVAPWSPLIQADLSEMFCYVLWLHWRLTTR